MKAKKGCYFSSHLRGVEGKEYAAQVGGQAQVEHDAWRVSSRQVNRVHVTAG